MAERRNFRRGALSAALAFVLLSNAAASDLAWQHYEDGLQAFDQHRFDLALTSWQEAVAQRMDRFTKVVAAVDTALAMPEATNVWDKIDVLVERLAVKEFGAREFAAIRDQAAGSTRREMETLHLRTTSSEFGNFTSAWLAVEELRGAAAIHNSLKALRSLALALQSYPEAEFGIGKIFFLEGELDLARLQYGKALDASASLEVPDDRIDILMALAEVDKAKGDWQNYEDDLRQSLADSNIFSSGSDFMRVAMERALDLEGFDVMAKLYPVDEPKILGPASELGEFLLRNGRSRATIDLALATDAMVTRIMTRLRVNEPTLGFVSLTDLAARIARDQELADWCNTMGLWKYLYYLGESLLADSRLGSGRQLLRDIAAAKGSGSWGAASRLALARPPGGRPALLP